MTGKGKKQSGSLGKAVLAGLCTSVLATAIMLIIASYMEDKEILSKNVCERITTIIQFVSIVIGCFTASRRIKVKKYSALYITSLGYILLLFTVSIVLFKGHFYSVLQGLLAIGLGMSAALGCVWRANNRSSSAMRRGYSR